MSPMLLVSTTALALVSLTAILSWFLPRLTRPELYFAVTVPAAFRDGAEGREILRRYRLELTLGSAVTLVAAFVLPRLNALLAPLAVYAEWIALFVVFLRARRHVLPYGVAPTSVREAPLWNHEWIVPGGRLAATGPFLILAAAAAFVGLHRGDFPARVLASLAGAFVPLVVLTVVLYGLAHWVRAVYVTGTQGARELRFRRTVAAVLLGLQYVVAIEWTWAAIRRLFPELKVGAAGDLAIGFLPLVVVALGIVTLAQLRQGGGGLPESRMGVPIGDRTLDRYWRLGVFYFNRSDPAIFVEQRFGLGYTVNFAHVLSWIIVVVPLLVAASVPLLIMHLRG